MAKVSANQLAEAVMKELDKYKGMAIECVKESAQDAAKTVQGQIKSGAPVRTGKYAKSWKTKVTKDTPLTAEVTVYSSTQYRLAHLLEHGHAKRGGGRTAAQIHIAPAEQEGIEQFERELKKGLRE